jgi:DNA-binding FadR family transcriptional regulator
MAERRLFQDIVDQILALVAEGAFPPGSRLPGERELAERFDVSRVTIREAEIALQAMGKVQIKPGAGVYVTEAAARGPSLPDVSAFELTEARSLFESEAAALAAPVISDQLLARLDDLLLVMSSDDSNDMERSNQADREFHLTIASASGNKAILHVIETLWRMRTELPQVRATHEAVCCNDAQSRTEEHAQIVRALRKRDSQEARLAMRAHFNRLLEAMLDATEQRELSELRRKAEESRARFLRSVHLQ